MRGALGFVLGFTLVFTAMGALAGTVGSFLTAHQAAVNLVSGAVVVLFGLNYLGVLPFQIFRGGPRARVQTPGFVSAVVFGVVFSLGWTPCVGAFLGTALLLASQSATLDRVLGMAMLLAYSLGLGVPFLLSAVLLDRLKATFDWIKRHYGVINKVCGALLVAIGVLMATGLLGRLLNTLR